MDNENESQVAAPDEELEHEEVDLESELPEETDWKAETTKSRKIATRYKNQNAKLKAELEKFKDGKQDSASKPQAAEPGTLDFAQKAYLAANGIKGVDELKIVQEALRETGKDLDALLESKFFQSMLKDHREARDTKDATPSATRRSNTAARDSVEYWVEKIARGDAKLSDIPNRELREKVVDARMVDNSSPFGN